LIFKQLKHNNEIATTISDNNRITSELNEITEMVLEYRRLTNNANDELTKNNTNTNNNNNSSFHDLKLQQYFKHKLDIYQKQLNFLQQQKLTDEQQQQQQQQHQQHDHHVTFHNNINNNNSTSTIDRDELL